jgi:hypothetical protein
MKSPLPIPGNNFARRVELGKKLASLSRKLAVSADRLLQFHKRRQLFIRVHNETLSVVAMCVSNQDRSPIGIHGCDAASGPTAFAEIVSDQFPSASFALHTAMTK